MKRASLNLKQLIFILIPSIGLLSSSNQVLAVAMLTIGTSTCTTLACVGSTITKTYVFKQPFSQAIPFSVQLFSSGKECLHKAVTSQNIALGHGVALGLSVEDNYLKRLFHFLKLKLINNLYVISFKLN